MPRERKEKGPYKHGQRWSIFLVRMDGERSVETFASQAAAEEAAQATRGEIDGRTIAGAVDAYLEHLRALGRRRPR